LKDNVEAHGTLIFSQRGERVINLGYISKKYSLVQRLKYYYDLIVKSRESNVEMV